MNSALDLEFTGERVIPNHPEIKHLYQEHVIRYMFASQFTKSKVVLDAGCGTGYGSFLLHEGGAKKVVGIDNAKDAIDYCNYNYKAKNLEFNLDDCTKCHLANLSFDVVVSFEVIEHLKMPDSFLSEVKRILKKNGIFVVSTPNKLTYLEDNQFHVTEYTEEEFRVMLGKYFSYVEIFYQSYPPALAIYKGGPNEGIEEIDIPDLGIHNNYDSALYFVALCYDKMPANSSSKLYLFNNKTLLQEEYPTLKKLIRKLEREVNTKNLEISRLKSEIKFNKSNSEGSKSVLYENYEKQINELQRLLDDVNNRLDNVYQSFTRDILHTHAEEILDKLYREILMRPPDELAIRHYLPRLINNEISEQDLRKILLESDEAKSIR